MKLHSLLCLLLPFSALTLVAQDQSQTSPVAAPVLTGPLQIQENPGPSVSTSPASVPDAAALSPAAPPPAPADTNAQGSNVTAQPMTNPYVPGSAPAPGEPGAPTPDSGMGSPGQNPPPSDPNSLIPPPQEALPPSPINSAGNEEKQRQDQKARYYTVKVKADKEEALSSLLDKADKAKSDEVKRQALREYYDLLAKRMKKIDSSLTDWIDTMHSAYLRRLAQLRVEPTIPMSLPPTPASSDEAAPSPSPTSSHKKRVVVTTTSVAPSPSPTPSHKKRVVVTTTSVTPSPSPTPSHKKRVVVTTASPAPSPKQKVKVTNPADQ